MGVPRSHPSLGSLPARSIPPGREEGTEPAVGGLRSAPLLRRHVPRSRRANARRGDHRRHHRTTHLPHVLTAVKAASLPRRPATGGFGLDAGSARAPQQAIVRRCRTLTLPHTDRSGGGSGSPRQRSGAARSCREGGSAFRLARESESARSVAAVTLIRAGAERRTCGACGAG